MLSQLTSNRFAIIIVLGFPFFFLTATSGICQSDLFSSDESNIQLAYEALLSGHIDNSLEILETEIFENRNYDAVPYYRMAYCAATEEEAPKFKRVKEATKLAKKANNHWGASLKQKSFKKARNVIIKKADNGDAVAQIILSFGYQCGCGIKKNYEKAFYYAELSANQGLPCALWTLGIYYYQGIGVEKDLEKAVEYLSLGIKNNPHPHSEKYLNKVKKKLAKKTKS